MPKRMLSLSFVVIVTWPGSMLLSLRDRDGRDDLDFRVDTLIASAFSVASSSVALISATAAEADRSEVGFELLGFLRLAGVAVVVSSCSSVALRFRSEREPSNGSSSMMRVLKMECEPGLGVPRAAGSKSLVSLDAEDRLLLAASVSALVSGSRALSTHCGHLQFSASGRKVSDDGHECSKVSLEGQYGWLSLPSSEANELASRAHCRCAAESVSLGSVMSVTYFC